MNARKAVLADNPELILRVLQLRFDESLNRPGFPGECFICELRLPDHRF